MDVLSLLKNKVKCVSRFREFSTDFLTIAERGDLSALDRFTSERDKMIAIIELHDRKISAATNALSMAERTPALVDAVRALLDEEERLISAIISIDKDITHHIGKEKDRLLRNLAQAEKSKELAGRFKSEWMPASGEGLDRTL